MHEIYQPHNEHQYCLTSFVAIFNLLLRSTEWSEVSEPNHLRPQCFRWVSPCVPNSSRSGVQSIGRRQRTNRIRFIGDLGLVLMIQYKYLNHQPGWFRNPTAPAHLKPPSDVPDFRGQSPFSVTCPWTKLSPKMSPILTLNRGKCAQTQSTTSYYGSHLTHRQRRRHMTYKRSSVNNSNQRRQKGKKRRPAAAINGMLCVNLFILCELAGFFCLFVFLADSSPPIENVPDFHFRNLVTSIKVQH